jgi:hypothetical protein
LVLGCLAFVAFVAFRIYDGVHRRRAAEWFERTEAAKYEEAQRAEYTAKKAEYAQLEVPFKQECADFIVIGALDPSKQESAVRKMDKKHLAKCDAAAGELNRRSRELAEYLQRGRERERAAGIK